VGCRQHDFGLFESPLIVRELDPTDHPSLPVSPNTGIRIKPATIAEMAALSDFSLRS